MSENVGGSNCAQSGQPRSRRCDLHDNQVHKVDGARLVQLRLVVVGIDRVRQLSEREPNVGEGNALALQVPVRHGERRYRLDEADEPVRLQDELPINEAVLARHSRFPQEYVGLRSLICEGDGSESVGEETGCVNSCSPWSTLDLPDDDHEEAAQDLRDAKGDVGHDWPELAETTCG